jgi:hypothetical protein
MGKLERMLQMAWQNKNKFVAGWLQWNPCMGETGWEKDAGPVAISNGSSEEAHK